MEKLTSESAGRLSPSLEQVPFLVLEITGEGVVSAANELALRSLGADVVGHPLTELLLDEASRRKFWRVLGDFENTEGARDPLELNVRGFDGPQTVTCYVVRDERTPERLWLVERPRNPRMASLHDELQTANSELSAIQRELTKKTSRLSKALDEIERKLADNESLSRQLHHQNEELETQNVELLTMTEQLHRGQDELLQMNQQLERRSRELQVAISGRSRFYASMSHELRTPVNAVLGYNDLLLAGVYGALNEQQELALERSQRAVRHLRELINDVLDISKIEAGKLDVEVEAVQLREFIEDLLATVQPMSSARGSIVHLALADGIDTLTTDPRRLRQIMLNLISNAIKYGGGKPIWVRSEVTPDGGAALEVVDNGPGIAPEHLQTIFDEFTQFGGSAETGTGLGLAIARRLARLLGGDLDASSTLGVGTTFRLRLPKAPPTPTARQDGR